MLVDQAMPTRRELVAALDEMTTPEAAEHFGVDRFVFTGWKRHYGLRVGGSRWGNCPDGSTLAALVNDGKTPDQIAEIYGVKRKTVTGNWFNRHGISWRREKKQLDLEHASRAQFDLATRRWSDSVGHVTYWQQGVHEY